MDGKAVLATILYLAVSLGVAACGGPKAPNSGSDEVSKQPVPRMMLFESEIEWMKHAKADKFKYWQVPRENAGKVVHLERTVGETGEFVARERQLCFNARHKQVPAVLLSDYQASSEEIQISKDDFVRPGEKFGYDNRNYIGNISLIGLHGSKEKIPQEFTDSPCSTGKKYDRYVIIFENPLSN